MPSLAFLRRDRGHSRQNSAGSSPALSFKGLPKEFAPELDITPYTAGSAAVLNDQRRVKEISDHRSSRTFSDRTWSPSDTVSKSQSGPYAPSMHSYASSIRSHDQSFDQRSTNGLPSLQTTAVFVDHQNGRGSPIWDSPSSSLSHSSAPFSPLNGQVRTPQDSAYSFNVRRIETAGTNHNCQEILERNFYLQSTGSSSSLGKSEERSIDARTNASDRTYDSDAGGRSTHGPRSIKKQPGKPQRSSKLLAVLGVGNGSHHHALQEQGRASSPLAMQCAGDRSPSGHFPQRSYSPSVHSQNSNHSYRSNQSIQPLAHLPALTKPISSSFRAHITAAEQEHSLRTSPTYLRSPDPFSQSYHQIQRNFRDETASASASVPAGLILTQHVQHGSPPRHNPNQAAQVPHQSFSALPPPIMSIYQNRQPQQLAQHPFRGRTNSSASDMGYESAQIRTRAGSFASDMQTTSSSVSPGTTNYSPNATTYRRRSRAGSVVSYTSSEAGDSYAASIASAPSRTTFQAHPSKSMQQFVHPSAMPAQQAGRHHFPQQPIYVVGQHVQQRSVPPPVALRRRTSASSVKFAPSFMSPSFMSMDSENEDYASDSGYARSDTHASLSRGYQQPSYQSYGVSARAPAVRDANMRHHVPGASSDTAMKPSYPPSTARTRGKGFKLAKALRRRWSGTLTPGATPGSAPAIRAPAPFPHAVSSSQQQEQAPIDETMITHTQRSGNRSRRSSTASQGSLSQKEGEAVRRSVQEQRLARQSSFRQQMDELEQKEQVIPPSQEVQQRATPVRQRVARQRGLQVNTSGTPTDGKHPSAPVFETLSGTKLASFFSDDYSLPNTAETDRQAEVKQEARHSFKRQRDSEETYFSVSQTINFTDAQAPTLPDSTLERAPVQPPRPLPRPETYFKLIQEIESANEGTVLSTPTRDSRHYKERQSQIDAPIDEDKRESKDLLCVQEADASSAISGPPASPFYEIVKTPTLTSAEDEIDSSSHACQISHLRNPSLCSVVSELYSPVFHAPLLQREGRSHSTLGAVEMFMHPGAEKSSNEEVVKPDFSSRSQTCDDLSVTEAEIVGKRAARSRDSLTTAIAVSPKTQPHIVIAGECPRNVQRAKRH